MAFLMRVALPDVPGSLGRLATAIGAAGGDIEAIEIVEKRNDGTVLDDVLLDLPDGVMPDSIVSACTALEDVSVVWISRYQAGGLMFDLEAVEELAVDPANAVPRLIDLLPTLFRVDWAALVHRADGVLTGTAATPADVAFVDIESPTRLTPEDDEDEPADTLFAAARFDGNRIVVVAREGGPEFLESELARLGHLAGLAASIARS